QSLTNEKHEDANKVFEVWRKIREEFTINLDMITSGVASKFESVANEANVSSQCVNSVKEVFNNASEKKTAAVEILDAWGKFPPSGTLKGAFASFGSYDECLQIESPKTHYCTIEFRYILPKRPRQSYRIIDIITPFYAQAVLNATLSVETFFVLSGLLTSYVTWSTVGGDYTNFSSVWYLLSRYFRLTPGLLAAIGGTLFLPLFGSGPLWHEIIDPVVNGCKTNWWVNLLFLQNYINEEQICLLPSWWLAVDMHFHIVSLFIIIMLMRLPFAGLIACGLLITVATVAGTIVHYIHGFPAAIVATNPQVDEYWLEYVLEFFYKPYVHAAPFFIGLILGYFIVEKVGGWTLALLVMFAVLKTPYYWNLGYNSSKLTSALYDCTNRIFWALAISWVIYACASNHG
ncbi:Nose resistant to fluoxetine protein 6-like protein, partial [Dinothrombium tinctorium]